MTEIHDNWPDTSQELEIYQTGKSRMIQLGRQIKTQGPVLLVLPLRQSALFSRGNKFTDQVFSKFYKYLMFLLSKIYYHAKQYELTTMWYQLYQRDE